MRVMRQHVTFANVVSCLALFVALGGTSYAAIKVTGKNVKNGSLTGSDIKNGSVGSTDIKDRGLLAKDFKAGQLPAGARGATGAQGPQGIQGPRGPAGPTYFARVNSSGTTVTGSATSVSKFGTGDYLVKFPFNVNACAATATKANFAGYGTQTGSSAITGVLIGAGSLGTDDNTVRVQGSADLAFALILACP